MSQSPDPSMGPIPFYTAQLEQVLATAKAAEEAESYIAAVQARRTANDLYQQLAELRERDRQASAPQTIEAKLDALVALIGKLSRPWVLRVEAAVIERKRELGEAT